MTVLFLSLAAGFSGVVHLLALEVLAFGIVRAPLVWRGREVLLDRRKRVTGEG